MTGTDDEQPPSISSLRSKFENLAAASGSAGGRSASTGAVSSNGKAKAVEDGAPAAGSRGGVGRPAARDGLEQSKPRLEADGPGHSNINGRLRRVSDPAARPVFSKPANATSSSPPSPSSKSNVHVQAASQIPIAPTSKTTSLSVPVSAAESRQPSPTTASAPVSPKPMRRPAPPAPAPKPPSISRDDSASPAPSVASLRSRFDLAETAQSGQTTTHALLRPTTESSTASAGVMPITRSISPTPSLDRRLDIYEEPATLESADEGPSRAPPVSRATKPIFATRSSGIAVRENAASPPRLPARKQTEPPPPIPSNKPIVSSASSMPSSTVSDAPPKLPSRSRTLTVGRESAPPPLPARGELPAPVARASFPPPLLGSSSNGSSSKPLPPPIRKTGVAPPVVTTPKQSISGDMSSDDDEDEEDGVAPISGIPASAARRALEDFPDSTHANRRPPAFKPQQRIANSHHSTCFAAFGRHLCSGLYQVKVYDLQMSELPLFVVDLRDTGLEFRVKEPKVTALCFRPAVHHGPDEGRYLWCGTKDGHIWELDLRTGQITDTKAFAHATGITHIFRYKSYMLSLDESGKAHIFDVCSTSADLRRIPNPARTIRTSDKQTFAAVIAGQLWTATTPAHRSTTNSASRGPSIRVYDPFSAAGAANPVGKTLFTTEWTGAVTSASVLPFDPSQVYLGHEGGFVSIWNAESLACTSVLKISNSDVLSLEGVGDKLWVGGRKGTINVYDVKPRPWRATNSWAAHPDQPIWRIHVDPFSIEHAGRLTVWSWAREGLKAWDGLLSVGWIDSQMVHRQPSYCSFRDINVLVCSWNIDSAKPSDLNGSVDNASFLDQCLKSVESPDIIVFGFQEVIPLTDKKLTAKTLLFGGKNKENGAADRVSASYRLWLDKLQSAVRMAMPPDCPYVKVHSENLVGLFSCIFVKTSQKEALRDLNIATVKRGMGGRYGNKGAIVARFVIDDTSICFINVHLAAGQSAKASRNSDLAAIMEEKAIFPFADELPYVNGGDGTAILDHEVVILGGDLNYRIDQRRDNVISSVNAGELAYLLEHDQLRKEMRLNQSFRLRSFDEAPITFKPTYKYTPHSQEYDASEKKRIPAWCDRILFTKSPRIRSLHYRRYEPTVSDHRPISAAFSIQIKSVDPAKQLEVWKVAGRDWAQEETVLLEKMAASFAELH